MKKWFRFDILKRNYVVYEVLITFFASVLRAVGAQLFLLPSRVIIGGVIGGAAIFELTLGANAWIFEASVWLVLLNLPLLVLSAVRLSKRVTVLTAANVILTAIFMFILKRFGLAERLGTTDEDNRILYTIIGGALSGFALPLMLSIHGTNGGTDIIAMLIKKYNDVHLMRIIMFFGVTVIAVASLILRDFDVFVYSIVAIFCQQVVEEMVFRGYSAAIVLEVTTEKPQEVSAVLLSAINRTCTHLRVKGMYKDTERSLLVCIISRRELDAARKAIRLADEAAFAYIMGAREVLGGGFTNKEMEIEDFD